MSQIDPPDGVALAPVDDGYIRPLPRARRARMPADTLGLTYQAPDPEPRFGAEDVPMLPRPKSSEAPAPQYSSEPADVGGFRYVTPLKGPGRMAEQAAHAIEHPDLLLSTAEKERQASGSPAFGADSVGKGTLARLLLNSAINVPANMVAGGIRSLGRYGDSFTRAMDGDKLIDPQTGAPMRGLAGQGLDDLDWMSAPGSGPGAAVLKHAGERGAMAPIVPKKALRSQAGDEHLSASARLAKASGLEDWEITSHEAAVDRSGRIERAVEARDGPRVMQQVDPIARSQDRMFSEASTLERSMKTAGKSQEEIAAAISEKFKTPVSADDVAKGNTWWRADAMEKTDKFKASAADADLMEPIERLKGQRGPRTSRTNWDEANMAELRRLNDLGLPVKEISKRMTEFTGAPVGDGAITSQVRNAKLERSRRVAWPDDIDARMLKWKAAGADPRDIASELSKELGRTVEPDAVFNRMARTPVGAGRDPVTGQGRAIGSVAWPKDAQDVIERGMTSDPKLTQAELAQALRDATGNEYSRSAVGGQIGRMRQEQVRIHGKKLWSQGDPGASAAGTIARDDEPMEPIEPIRKRREAK